MQYVAVTCVHERRAASARTQEGGGEDDGHREGVDDIEAEAARDQRELAVEWQRLDEPVEVTRHELARGALRELGEEGADLAEVGHAPLAHLAAGLGLWWEGATLGSRQAFRSPAGT